MPEMTPVQKSDKPETTGRAGARVTRPCCRRSM